MPCSVVVLSTYRLVTIIEHKSGTYPVLDPSWYAPISIILGAVEVDIASMCASVPVFWPLLRAQLGGIFVTKEIEITHEDRHNYFEMRRGRNSDRSLGGGDSRASFQGSEVCFGSADMERVGADNTSSTTGPIVTVKDPARHYEDEYVRQRVNPFVGIGGGQNGEKPEVIVAECQARSESASANGERKAGSLRLFS